MRVGSSYQNLCTAAGRLAARGCSPEESAQTRALRNAAPRYADPPACKGLFLREEILFLRKRDIEFRGEMERFGHVPTEAA